MGNTLYPPVGSVFSTIPPIKRWLFVAKLQYYYIVLWNAHTKPNIEKNLNDHCMSLWRKLTHRFHTQKYSSSPAMRFSNEVFTRFLSNNWNVLCCQRVCWVMLSDMRISCFSLVSLKIFLFSFLCWKWEVFFNNGACDGCFFLPTALPLMLCLLLVGAQPWFKYEKVECNSHKATIDVFMIIHAMNGKNLLYNVE